MGVTVEEGADVGGYDGARTWMGEVGAFAEEGTVKVEDVEALTSECYIWCASVVCG